MVWGGRLPGLGQQRAQVLQRGVEQALLSGVQIAAGLVGEHFEGINHRAGGLQVERALAGARVRDALKAVERIPPFSELQLEEQTVGIFGRIVDLNELLGPNDRVEVYRPLVVDPKEARRRRLGGSA